MKIILTGASGFLGSAFNNSWKTNHQVITVGRSSECDMVCDISKGIPDLPNSDFIVHAAGKAHLVPKTTAESNAFYEVNVQGTINLLAAIPLSSTPKMFIFISSVSVYGVEKGHNIDETQPLLAVDAYGKSKMEAEQLVIEWGIERSVPIVILRLPLVAGSNPPGNLGAMIKAVKKGYYFRIGNGDTQRSVVLASDIAKLIPELPLVTGIYNLTSTTHPAISEIDSLIGIQLSKKIHVMSVPVAGFLAKIGDVIPFFPFNKRRLQKLTQSLTFSDQKARTELNWKPGSIQDWNIF